MGFFLLSFFKIVFTKVTLVYKTDSSHSFASSYVCNCRSIAKVPIFCHRVEQVVCQGDYALPDLIGNDSYSKMAGIYSLPPPCFWDGDGGSQFIKS